MARTPGPTLLLLVALAGCSFPRLVDEGRVDEAYLQRVIDRTATVRGIAVGESPVRWSLLTGEQQRQKVRAEVAAVTTRATSAIKTLAAFGLVDADFGPERLAEVYADQVAAHYDTTTKTFYLVERPSGAWFTSWLLERDLEGEFVACHEVVHALQDRRHDIEAFMARARNGDEEAARQAVVEGDATYFGLRAMFEGLVSDRELDELEVDPSLADDALGSLEGVPPAVGESMLFPYLDGLRLLQALGPDRRAIVWDTPPRSTEQVLHPEKFLAGEEPDEVILADDQRPDGWTLVSEDTLGELGLRLVLSGAEDVTREEAAAGAAGWGGDRVRIYEGPSGALALAWALSFDTPEDAREFVRLYRRRVVEAARALSALATLHGPRGAVVVEAPDGAALKAIAPAALLHVVVPAGSERGE